MPNQMQEAMSQALKRKTIKFDKPKNTKEESVSQNFPPSFMLSTRQLTYLVDKEIGDKCEFYIKTKIVGIDKTDEEPTRYRFDVEEMTFESKKEKESSDEQPMKKAYNKATEKDKYVALRTEQVTG